MRPEYILLLTPLIYGLFLITSPGKAFFAKHKFISISVGPALALFVGWFILSFDQWIKLVIGFGMACAFLAFASFLGRKK